jgi:hypothetical protein
MNEISILPLSSIEFIENIKENNITIDNIKLSLDPK